MSRRPLHRPLRLASSSRPGPGRRRSHRDEALLAQRALSPPDRRIHLVPHRRPPMPSCRARRRGSGQTRGTLGVPAILCFLARGDLQLHSAAVEIDGRAVVIAAPQIHGKTTFAAMCHNAGFRILSEDATCIRDLNSPHVIPGPAVLRLRRATAERIEITGAREVTERDHRLISIDPERRGDCSPVPLRAILMLRESEAGFRLERPNPLTPSATCGH